MPDASIRRPILVAGFGAGDLVAKGTSLVAMIASSTVGTVANSRAKLVDLRAALVGAMSTPPSSLPVRTSRLQRASRTVLA